MINTNGDICTINAQVNYCPTSEEEPAIFEYTTSLNNGDDIKIDDLTIRVNDLSTILDIEVGTDKIQEYKLNIYDLEGRRYNIPVYSNSRNNTLDISNLTNGIYYLVLTSPNHVIYKFNIDDGFGYSFADSRTYFATGIELEPYTDKRTILILVDRTLYPELEKEINRLRNDLVSEGWGVRVSEVNRMEFEEFPETRVEKILDLYYLGIRNYFLKNTNLNTESIFVIGKTPKFYSGKYAPDDKENHIGAWPADGFFSMKDDIIGAIGAVERSDNSDWERNNYGRNEWYFDHNTFPDKVDLMVGSLDLSDLSSFEESEVELIRRYLDKNHKYRTGQLPFRRRGLIDDNLEQFKERDVPASSGWRNFNSMFGPDSITEGDYFTTLENESYMASYACGKGQPFDSLDGVGSSKDFATRQVNTIFTMLYGDYIGDWDSPNNFLRAALASEPSILTAAWVGHPHWFFHHMSIGYPIGYSTRLTQNNKIYNAIEHYIEDTVSVNYDPYKNGSHTAMLGDPTLTMYPLNNESRISNLKATKLNDYTVRLDWDLPNDEEVHLYDIFRSSHEFGPFEQVNTLSNKNGSHIDAFHYTGDVWYMVRERVLEYSPTASFWKHLRGEIVQTEVITDVEVEDISDDIVIIPNPVSDKLMIEIKNLSLNELDISIFDSQGNLVKSFNNNSNINNQLISWDLMNDNNTRVSSGAYFLQVVINDNTFIKKFVVVK